MSDAVKIVSAALDAAGMKVISADAGTALRAIFPEGEIHAAFLQRDDIAALSNEQQYARWEDHKRGIKAFMSAMSGVPLRGPNADLSGRTRSA